MPLVRKVLPERRELKERRVQPDRREPPGQPGRRVPRELPALRDSTGWKAHADSPGLPGSRVRLALLEPLVLLAQPGLPGKTESTAFPEGLEPQALPVLRALRETRALRVLRARRERRALREQQVQLAPRELLGLTVHPAPLEQAEPRARRERRESELRARKAQRERQDQPDSTAWMAPRVHQAHWQAFRTSSQRRRQTLIPAMERSVSRTPPRTHPRSSVRICSIALAMTGCRCSTPSTIPRARSRATSGLSRMRIRRNG